MIKHIVMWNLRGDTPAQKAEAAALVKSVFEGMRGKIPGMRHIEIGSDISRIDYACDVVLYSEFESQAALDAYAIHPQHIEAKERLANVRVARHQVDYAVTEQREKTERTRP
jgi:hypothetical protein